MRVPALRHQPQVLKVVEAQATLLQRCHLVVLALAPLLLAKPVVVAHLVVEELPPAAAALPRAVAVVRLLAAARLLVVVLGRTAQVYRLCT